MHLKRLSAINPERKLDLKYIGIRNDATFKIYLNLKQEINKIIRNINLNLDFNKVSNESLQPLQTVIKNNIILQLFEALKKKLDEKQLLFFELVSKGYEKKYFSYLLEFWDNIRKNQNKLNVNPKIFLLTKEINKNVINLESKLELNKEEFLKIKYSKDVNKIYNRIHINKLNNNYKKFSVNETKLNLHFHKKSLTNDKIEINHLENPLFQNREEILTKNIIEKTKNNIKMINFIDIDLFLKRIAQMKNIYDDPIMETNLLKGFCLQHTAFIKTDVLVSKIISCFNYFYYAYLNKDNETKLNNKNIDGFVKLRNKYGNKPLNKKEESNKNILKRDSKLIPFNIINLFISFVDLHIKYCGSTINKEIIEKIQTFYKDILEINTIKSKYGKEISASFDVLKRKKNSSLLKRTKLINHKIPYERLFSNKILVKDLIRSSDNPNSFFNLLDFDSKEIATELTNISYKLYAKLETKEFLKAVFTKKNKNETSPNIVEIYNRFNKVSFWCIEEILMYDKKRYRGKIIEKFIDIINELLILNNFFDSMSLSAALSQIIISNLTETWKRVSKKSKEMYQEAKNFLSFDYNYQKLRDKINDCVINDKSYIPFLGPYSKSLCYLEEYGPYVKEKSLINVDKIVLVQQTLDQLFKFKLNNNDNPIKSKKNELIMLHYLDPASEEELEKLASLLEPKFRLNDKKQKEKRASNTEKNFKKNYEDNKDTI